MVNKEKILTELKRSVIPVSGESLSKLLGISRTAVWKNINSLKKSGYKITGGATGYSLEKEEDKLTPYEFDSDSGLFTYFETATSTMDLAKDLIDRGKARDGSVIICESQVAGIGKDNSIFKSPKGGLYFTVVYYPDTPNFYMNLYPIAGTLAVNIALKKHLKIDTQLRWPFENLIENKKISGIITDTYIESNKIKWQSLGIGINYNLKGLRKDILETIRSEIDILTKDPETMINLYKYKLDILDSVKSFNIEGKTYKGRVTDIDFQGTISLNGSGNRCYIGNSYQEDL